MQTNVLGGQFADGGVLASKPYAASANYINKMSDYCKNCKYKKSDRTGDKACPFNRGMRSEEAPSFYKSREALLPQSREARRWRIRAVRLGFPQAFMSDVAGSL